MIENHQRSAVISTTISNASMGLQTVIKVDRFNNFVIIIIIIVITISKFSNLIGHQQA